MTSINCKVADAKVRGECFNCALNGEDLTFWDAEVVFGRSEHSGVRTDSESR